MKRMTVFHIPVNMADVRHAATWPSYCNLSIYQSLYLDHHTISLTEHFDFCMCLRPEAYNDSEEEEEGQSDSDDSYSWRTERVKSVLQSRIHKPDEGRQRHRSTSYEREDFEAGGMRSIVGTTIKRTSGHDSAESGEITGSDEESDSRGGDKQGERSSRGKREKEEASDRHRRRRTEDSKRTRDPEHERSGHRSKGRQDRDEEEEYREAERNFRKRRFHRTQEESRNRRDEGQREPV